MSLQFQNIHLEKRAGGAWITLDKPPLNILDIPMMRELSLALESVSSDSEVKVVVLQGKGRAFSAGVDIRDHTADRVEEMLGVFHRIFRLLLELHQPTLAVVQGSALGGGCELALFCDLVLAAENSRFGQPEIKVGVFPPIAAIVFPRLTSPKKALELLLIGDAIDAQEAHRLGLVNRVVPLDKLEEAAKEMVNQLTSLSGVVLKVTKRAILQGQERDFLQALRTIEGIYLRELMATEDASEGLRAFMEKRPPVWRER